MLERHAEQRRRRRPVAGLPGLAGFWGEVLALLGAWERYPILTAISTVGLIVTAAFFLMTIRKVFFGPAQEKYRGFPDVTLREWTCLAPFGALCVIAGVFPAFLLNWMVPSIQSLVQIITPK